MAAASDPFQSSSNELKNSDLGPICDPILCSEKNEMNRDTAEFKVPDISLSEKDISDATSLLEKNANKKSKKLTVGLSWSNLSPAEQLKHSQVIVPYKEPIWSGIPPETDKYSFDVLKDGTIIDCIELGKKPWIVFGRLPSCDVCLEHPSLSRYHAVVQYRDTPELTEDRGWYLYDMDSTHGTWINKVKVQPKIYHRLHVGHVIKFGGSTRLHILQGPEEDREAEAELSITELKARKEKLQREAELLRHADDEDQERERQLQECVNDGGCSWGITEDAAEEPEENPFASLVPQHEHLYSDDPKKALRGFYEREGFDLPDYQFTEVSFGKHRCVVELPVDGPNGEPLIAEVTISGKKKDAVVACALEACRLLDVHGLLHAAKHESRKRKRKNWEDEDFYDSDEDTFLDRTGTIESKRLFRMKKSGKDTKAETYESLLPKHEAIVHHITEIESKLEQAKAQTKAAMEEEEDALDAYMTAIKAGVMDTKTRLTLKRELLTLRTEEQRLRRMVNLAKPAVLPELKKYEPSHQMHPVAAGFVAGVRKITVPKGPKKPSVLPNDLTVCPGQPTFEEEVEEDEDDDSSTKEEEKKSPPVTNNEQCKPQETVKPPGVSQTSLRTLYQKPHKKDSGSLVCVTEKVKTQTEISVESNCERKEPILPKHEVSISGSDAAQVSAPKGFSEPKTKVASFTVAKRSKKVDAPNMMYDDADPNYAMWLPPSNQSGDGRTSLNDKLGY